MFLGTHRCHSTLHKSPISPGRAIDSIFFEPDIHVSSTQPLRAKRKLDMDDPCPTSVKRAKSGIHFTVFIFRIKKVLLLFSVTCFWCQSLTFHLTCVHIIFSSVSVAEWPPFGK